VSVHADLFAQGASEVVLLISESTRYRYVIDATSGARKGQLWLTPEAADSLYLKLGAVLHGADEPARETAYQEQQVKDAVEHGLGTEGIGVDLSPTAGATWTYYDHRESQEGENRD
jgi:hypothetical protein